jgi:hypothetical protein
MAYTNIDFPAEYFNTAIWTADGTGSRAITTGHSTDMVWIKFRDFSYDHRIYDDVRGVTKKIITNKTDAESTTTDMVSFDTNGFTVSNDLNTSGEGKLVGWSWKANGAGVSNTAGSITSTVSANTTSGFSIVSYTGNGSSSATVGHGLGVTPALVIIKPRDALSANGHWYSKHKSLASNNNIFLNLTNATTDVSGQSAGGIGNLSSSSTFGFVNGTSDISSVNFSSGTYIAYCFAEVKGFSKFGSYTGNGASGNGTFTYLGFKPAFVMIKETSGIDGWGMFDNKRVPYNYVNTHVQAQSSSADITNTADAVDFLSNGFKVATGTSSANFINESGASYIYMAFAENPFVSSKGIPTTAR